MFTDLERKDLKDDEKLACLAVRLGLDFQATSWLERTAERTQVERHMRLCLSASAGFQNMVTISPSEPLLAEAAAAVMHYSKERFCPAQALVKHIDSSYLSAGERGEVLGALLFMMARDAAIRQLLYSSNLTQYEPHFLPVCDVLPQLINRPSEVLLNHKPTQYLTQTAKNQTFGDCFKDARIWVNHFIKVKDYSVINRDFLWYCIVRGAAIICANGHRGIDMIVPTLFGDALIKEMVSAIFAQYKNDASYGPNLVAHLFAAMDPFNVGLFSRNVKDPKPIIRIVFALAARRSNVELRKQPQRASTRKKDETAGNAKFTAYDFWCAGATHETFKVIEPAKKDVYAQLLLRTQNLSDPYKVVGMDSALPVAQERAAARRQMHPCVGKEVHHHNKFIGGLVFSQDGQNAELSAQVAPECLSDEELEPQPEVAPEQKGRATRSSATKPAVAPQPEPGPSKKTKSKSKKK